MRFPIRYQFMLPLLVVAVVSLLSVGIVYSRMTGKQTRERIEQQLQGVVEALDQSSYPLTDSVLRQMGGIAGAEFVLTEPGGRRLSAGSDIDVSSIPGDSFHPQAVKEVALGQVVEIGGRRYLHSTVAVRPRMLGTGPGVLHILFPQDDYNAAWRAAFVPPLVVGLATIAAVVLATHLIAARVSRTLSALGADVRRLAEGDFSPVSPTTHNDETQDLAAAIDQTAGRLIEYEAELRRTEQLRTVSLLGAGLAHELRNAATGCRLAIDLHSEACPESKDDSLTVARRQVAVIENRLKQLLQMGRGEVQPQPIPVDLRGIVSQCVDLVSPSANHAGVALEWRVPEQSTTVIADPELLEQSIMNLLLNALDAAAKSQAAGRVATAATVGIRVTDRGDAVLVEVYDTGDGPPETAPDAVFEPFVTSKAEGVGLGLAVARRAIESLGGRINWRRIDHQTCFRIELPTGEGAANV